MPIFVHNSGSEREMDSTVLHSIGRVFDKEMHCTALEDKQIERCTRALEDRANREMNCTALEMKQWEKCTAQHWKSIADIKERCTAQQPDESNGKMPQHWK